MKMNLDKMVFFLEIISIKNETQEQKRGFLEMLLRTLGTSQLGNMLAGKGIVRAGYGKKKGKGIARTGL